MADASFDIIIAGTSLPGLAYAALAAKQGYTVAIVGHDAKPAQYTVGEHQLNRTVPLIYGFNTSTAVRTFFRDIGLLAEMRNKPASLDPYLQVVTPGSRFDLSERQEQNRQELQREFADSLKDIDRFFKTVAADAPEIDAFVAGLPMVPPKGLWDRFKFRGFLKKHPVAAGTQTPVTLPPELKFSTPENAMLQFLSRLHSDSPSPLVMRRMLQHIHAGFFEFPQGIDGLKRLFTDRVVANGGAFWPERTVEQILVKRKRVIEVAVQRPRRTSLVRLVVCNCPPRAFFPLIPQERQDSRYHSFVKSLQPATFNYVVNFVVRSDLLPESMGRNVVLAMDPRQEATGANVLWIYVEPRPELPESPVTLTVTARLAPKDLPLEGPDFDALNERILCSLEWLLPFIREKLLRVHTPYATVDRETERVRLNPSEVQEVYRDPVPGSLDLTAVGCRTAYKNILVLGDHYLGALGFEGSILAAQQAFAWTCKNVVLKKILRK
jgi:phytoene dehydrogenase-like protein